MQGLFFVLNQVTLGSSLFTKQITIDQNLPPPGSAFFITEDAQDYFLTEDGLNDFITE